MRRLVAAQWARRKRRLGDYDQATLAGFLAAWRHSGALSDLLAYALFRRDLGRPLPARWVEPLRHGLNRLMSDQRRLALGLLAEYGPTALTEVSTHWLADAAGLPALASLGLQNADPLVARIDTQQAAWRAEFAQWVAQRRAQGGLCVVGNAAVLQGLALGPVVDASAGVVRFNRYGADASLQPDVGRRTDVWVVSPGYQGPAPGGVSWVVMTGPDVRYRLQEWSTVLPLLQAGVPVLTVPLTVWRELVKTLQAPPSAGVLMLAWLASMGGAGWSGLHSAGIGSGLTGDGRYHKVAARQAAGSRHHWPAEQQLVAQWQQQGLNGLCQPSTQRGSGPANRA